MRDGEVVENADQLIHEIAVRGDGIDAAIAVLLEAFADDGGARDMSSLEFGDKERAPRVLAHARSRGIKRLGQLAPVDDLAGVMNMNHGRLEFRKLQRLPLYREPRATEAITLRAEAISP